MVRIVVVVSGQCGCIPEVAEVISERTLACEDPIRAAYLAGWADANDPTVVEQVPEYEEGVPDTRVVEIGAIVG